MQRTIFTILLVAFGTGATAHRAYAQDLEAVLGDVKLLTFDQLRDLIQQATDGDVDAQLRVGLAYQHGYRAQQLPAEAVKYYGMAADQGFAPAQYLLAKMYFAGEGVARDSTAGIQRLNEAAEGGFAEAQYEYGLLCLDGVGVPQSNAEAFRWFQRAAAQGSMGGQTYLGILYVNGMGVPANPSEGFRYLKMAGERGSPMAHANLGAMYANGVGVGRDANEALIWFYMAEAGGFEGVAALIANLQRGKSEGEVGELKRQADERYKMYLEGPEVTAPTHEPTDVSILDDPDVAQATYDSIAGWIGRRLPEIGTFRMRLTDDWAQSSFATAGIRQAQTVTAGHQIEEAVLEDCVLAYRSNFIIEAASVSVPQQWFVPLANVDQSSIRVQRYELPNELRAQDQRYEVYLRAVPDGYFLLIDSEQTRRSALEHGIAADTRKEADELAEGLRTATGICQRR